MRAEDSGGTGPLVEKSSCQTQSSIHLLSIPSIERYHGKNRPPDPVTNPEAMATRGSARRLLLVAGSIAHGGFGGGWSRNPAQLQISARVVANSKKSDPDHVFAQQTA
jgi:hypothetical protein